jgi:hypothetical protein
MGFSSANMNNSVGSLHPCVSAILESEIPKTKWNKICLKIKNILEHIFSFVAFPFIKFDAFLGKYSYRKIDPAWRAFVSEGNGHFNKREDKEKFIIAAAKADAIFDAVIAGSSKPEKWHAVHMEKKKNRDVQKLWSGFSKPGNSGTCMGNSTSLMYHVIKAKKTLSIDELKKIEKTEKFAIMSQTFHLMTENLRLEYLREGTKDHPPRLAELDRMLAESKKNGLSDEEKTKITKGLDKKWDVIFDDVNGQNLGSNFHSLKKLNLLPGNLELIDRVPTMGFKNAAVPIFLNPDLRCVVIISAYSKEPGKKGHSMFLEIDKKKGLYIFYDNNSGYYQWKKLDSCLSDIEARLHKYYDFKYDFCNFAISHIE